jgi:hypothetical protein
MVKIMKINKHVLWITQSALLIAVLVAWQAVSRAIPGTLVTGMGVNFILIIATVVCSLKTGICVAAISPIMAQLFGIAPPFPILVPILALGNIVLVLAWYFLAKREPAAVTRIIAIVIGAAAKFGIIYLGVNLIVIALLETQLPPPVLAAFGIRQLFTAGIGGALAYVVIPLLNKALPKKTA